MSLFIEEEGNIKLDFDTEEIATLVIDAALELADCPYEAEINLLLTENAQIHEMNLEQRGIDRPTDVLSFPMIEYEEPGDFSVIDEEWKRNRKKSWKKSVFSADRIHILNRF